MEGRWILHDTKGPEINLQNNIIFVKISIMSIILFHMQVDINLVLPQLHEEQI